MITNDSQTPDALQNIAQHISAYLANAPFLLWRINIVKKEISYLNTSYIQGLGNDTLLLLKNMEFARSTVLNEDFDRFETFMNKVHDRQAASALFRIKNHDGMMLWVHAAGIPDPAMSSCYVGILSECTSLAAEALAMDTPSQKLESRIELFENPVLLCRFDDKRVVITNSAALLFFGKSHDDVGRISLYDLLAEDTPCHMDSVYESLIFAERWNGQLTFSDCQHNKILCDVSIRSLSSGGENYLWVALAHPKATPSKAHEITPEISADTLLGISRSKTIPGLLEALLNAQPMEAPADAMMLSRIFIPANRIMVSAAGTGFDPKEETTHPYKGSIAENIVNFGLRHIIVEDTSKSIKPIDWALFIPKGVRSYYAQPLYNDNELRAVLIFCATEPGRFSESNIGLYQQFFTHFRKGLQHCLEPID